MKLKGYKGFDSGASAGKGCVAMSVGMGSKAKGDIGSFLVLTECEEINGEFFIKKVKCRKVDGRRIKPDTYYTMKDGKFIEINK